MKSMQERETDFFNLLHDVAHLLRTRFDQQARAWGLTRAQCVILIHLQEHPGWTQNEMANHCQLEPITVARLVDRLEASGFVERRLDPSDRRINRLHLKPPADPILEQIRRSRENALRALMDDMTPAVKDAVMTTLKQMKVKLTTGCMARVQDASKEKTE
jgi:MarR family transcriptional regulator, transcriptional regulator for hemolysin